MERRWEGLITYEGQETGDDRTLAVGALNWEAPIPLKLNHDSEIAIGAITVLERRDGGAIYGSGVFFDSEEGRAAAQEVANWAAQGMGRGISVDLDDVSMELRIREEVLAKQEEAMAALFGGEETVEEPEKQEVDEAGRVKVGEIKSGDYMTVVTSARVRAASLAVIPAFKDATIGLVADEAEMSDDDVEVLASLDLESGEWTDALVAGAYPVAPPAEWFDNPAFTAATPLTITDDGRIYGHGATWGTFHIGFGGQKIEAPRSKTNYAYFQTGAIRTAEGTEIPIGRITMSTGHAQDGLSALDTMAHYDNTSAVVADVACGEDAYGIWVSGALRPSVTDEQVRELRAAPLSGDWREIRGNLELVALLAVNTAGFPIPRMSALVASGEVRSLVASAQFGAAAEAGDDLTAEERQAVRDLLAERNAEDDAGEPDETEEGDATPEDDQSCAEANQADSDEHTTATDKTKRAEAAKRKFRIEQAKLRALKARI
jgi:hypothetical protein